MRARAAVLATLAAIVMSLASAPSALGASTNRVLILGSTVTGGAQSLEATKAASLGYGVDIVSPATWATLTAADFARYRAIILGDPTCRVGTDSVAAAEANVGVWTPVVNGNVAVVGTDPVFHATFGINQPAARALSDNAVAFASAAPGLTGAYISLSCYYAGAPTGAPIRVLDGFAAGGFTFDGAPESDAVHLTRPTSPLVAGLTDTDLSGWGASVHDALATWPSAFDVVAVATVPGHPYILSRGPLVPTSKQQCQNGGWRAFGPMFKNQGQCVAYVERGPKS